MMTEEKEALWRVEWRQEKKQHGATGWVSANAPICDKDRYDVCFTERLIHLELADLVATCVYLDPEWPNVESSSNEVTAMSSRRKKSNQKSNGNVQPCPTCHSIHREIFEFERWKWGKNTGKEWELVVKPVIERWGKFVEKYVWHVTIVDCTKEIFPAKLTSWLCFFFFFSFCVLEIYVQQVD